MRKVSLCLLIKEENGKIVKVLLAMKKRGFGENRWNGVGGKIDVEKGDKNVSDSAVREAQEEIGVRILNPEKFAIMDFYFPFVPEEKDFNQQVHLFIVREWEGDPVETEEMRPQWFNVDQIPFDEMWDDDKFWIPHILNGKKFKAEFHFGEQEQVIKQMIDLVEELE